MRRGSRSRTETSGPQALCICVGEHVYFHACARVCGFIDVGGRGVVVILVFLPRLDST